MKWPLKLSVKASVINIQFNSIYLLIRQTCWHTTMLHKIRETNPNFSIENALG